MSSQSPWTTCVENCDFYLKYLVKNNGSNISAWSQPWRRCPSTTTSSRSWRPVKWQPARRKTSDPSSRLWRRKTRWRQSRARFYEKYNKEYFNSGCFFRQKNLKSPNGRRRLMEDHRNPERYVASQLHPARPRNPQLSPLSLKWRRKKASL